MTSVRFIWISLVFCCCVVQKDLVRWNFTSCTFYFGLNYGFLHLSHDSLPDSCSSLPMKYNSRLLFPRQTYTFLGVARVRTMKKNLLLFFNLWKSLEKVKTLIGSLVAFAWFTVGSLLNGSLEANSVSWYLKCCLDGCLGFVIVFVLENKENKETSGKMVIVVSYFYIFNNSFKR